MKIEYSNVIIPLLFYSKPYKEEVSLRLAFVCGHRAFG